MEQEDVKVIFTDEDNLYLAKFYLYVNGILQFSVKRAANLEIEEWDQSASTDAFVTLSKMMAQIRNYFQYILPWGNS